MYELLMGPLALLSLLVFFIGLLVRAVLYIRGLDWKLDRVAYREHFTHGLRGAMRSIFFWLFPYGTRAWRYNPFFTLLVFVFHIGLITVPLFLPAHNMILQQKLGVKLWSMPEIAADLLTITVIAAAVFLILRRIALAHVRILTTRFDYFLLVLVLAPFVTGFLAYHQANGSYDTWLVLHMITAEVLLILVPFTKLSHAVLFFLTRAQLGMDFGIKRGGMKSKGLAW